MKLYTVGQRVNTDYGNGTVIGFETFGSDGYSTDHAQIDNGISRICVQLDFPDNFHLNKYGNPFFFRSDKLEIL